MARQLVVVVGSPAGEELVGSPCILGVVSLYSAAAHAHRLGGEAVSGPDTPEARSWAWGQIALTVLERDVAEELNPSGKPMPRARLRAALVAVLELEAAPFPVSSSAVSDEIRDAFDHGGRAHHYAVRTAIGQILSGYRSGDQSESRDDGDDGGGPTGIGEASRSGLTVATHEAVKIVPVSRPLLVTPDIFEAALREAIGDGPRVDIRVSDRGRISADIRHAGRFIAAENASDGQWGVSRIDGGDPGDGFCGHDDMYDTMADAVAKIVELLEDGPDSARVTRSERPC